jgi:hypothetical protein
MPTWNGEGDNIGKKRIEPTVSLPDDIIIAIGGKLRKVPGVRRIVEIWDKLPSGPEKATRSGKERW